MLVQDFIKHKSTPAFFAMVLTVLTVLSCLVLSSPRASADNTGSIDASVNISAACSLSVDDTSHSASVIPGNDVLLGTSTVTAFCNDPSGLAVYMVGYTGNEYGNTSLTATINETTQTIATGDNGSPSNSQWNVTLTPVTGTYAPQISSGFSSQHVIPSQYTKVAYRTTMTGVGASTAGANFTAAFNAHVSTSQPAGIYTGKVKVLLVHPNNRTAPATPAAVAHQICYFGNGEDAGAMACQTSIDIDGSSTAITANAEVQLRAPNFSRSGYGFKSWNTKEDGSGTNYGPNETITFTQDMYDNGLMLFANWVEAETDVTMQTFDDTASPYATADIGTVIALKDTRDSDVYAVAKLADGKWWMIENLRLDHKATITTSNTQSYNGAFGGSFAGLAESETSNFTNSTAANSLYTIDETSTDLIIIAGGSYFGYRFPRYNNRNTATRVANQTGYNQNIYGYGNYYTWAAAIANTNRYTSTNTATPRYSICPTGWHLPKGGDKSNEANNEWWALIVTGIMEGTKPIKYDDEELGVQPRYKDDESNSSEGTTASKAVRKYPNNLVFSGYHGTSSVSNRGKSAGYWSSTSYTSANSYYTTLYPTYIYPGTYRATKATGRSVRCIAN